MIPRIREVYIENFKSIEKARVTLEPFTVLVGQNGSGKSNFVDVLEFVRDSLTETPQLALKSRMGFQHVVSRFNVEKGVRLIIGNRPITNSIKIRLNIVLNEDTSGTYVFELREDAASNSGITVKSEECFIRRANDLSSSYTVRDGGFEIPVTGIRPHIAPDRLALSAVSALEEFHPLYEFLTSMRFYRINADSMRIPKFVSEPADYLREDGSNAVAIYNRLSQKGNGHSDRYLRIGRLIEKVSACNLGVTHTIEAARRMNASTEDADAIQYLQFMQATGPDSAQNLDASYMSDGTLESLGCLLAAYQAGFQSIIAIEEPEATIHPAAAEVLYQAFVDASHNRQILIVTHSPDILYQKDLSSENIRVVAMEHGRTYIAPVTRGGREAIRKKLYMPGELLQMNELNADIEAAKRFANSPPDA